MVYGHAKWLKYRICEPQITSLNPPGVFIRIDRAIYIFKRTSVLYKIAFLLTCFTSKSLKDQ